MRTSKDRSTYHYHYHYHYHCVVLCSLLLVLGTGSGLGYSQVPEPVEITPTEPALLPPLWKAVREGHWIHGINFPWDSYGVDVGFNLWGDRGLGNQGPSGWRRETRSPDDAAKRLFWAQRSETDYCMGARVELRGAGSNAFIYFRFDELPGKMLNETINLTGQTVTADVYLPAGIAGPPDARSGLLLFLQDVNWLWAQTEWKNIDATGRWITLSVAVDELVQRFPGFDPARIRTVGIKVGSNTQISQFSYTGNLFFDNVRSSTSPELQFDFQRQDTRTEQEMKDIAGGKVKVVRWWLFSDGRAGLKFDANGFVTGLDETFNRDFDEMIRVARSSRVYLVPVLFDFLMGGEAGNVDGVQIFGRADLITNQAKRQSLLNNAIAPLFDKLSSVNEVIAIDLFNEPEWLLLGSEIPNLEAKRPPEIRQGGVVALDTMKSFFREIRALYEKKGLSGKHLLTVGSASPRWVDLWEDLGLDIAQFHLWNGPGQIDEGLRFDFPPPTSKVPVFLGEFSTVPALAAQDTCEILQRAYSLGYSGAFPWAYRAKDKASLPLLGPRTRECLAAFANDNPGVVEFTCLKDPATACLSRGRVKVTVDWKNQYNGAKGNALVIPQKDEFAYFHFGDPNNPELFVKVLDFGTGKAILFVGGLSDFEYTVTFQNSRGATVTFLKPAGGLCGFADGSSLEF